ncbi:TPA: CDP-glycerol glycerophosphotransferase family protein, partial [Escherichia coli]|nr:CDP-glycerol glycerophosphotransferase family protein [Escherichia coli]
QDLFKRAKIMITDYSSVAFEMAYLRKSVCYYQFDEQEFFTKGHYNKGYFDYRQSGFGPVFNTIDGVLSFLHDTIRGVYPNAELYKRRAFDFFPYRDGKCCERVLEAIIQLEQPRKKQPDISILKWADNAYKTGDYIHACYRYDLIKHNKNLLSGKSN